MSGSAITYTSGLMPSREVVRSLLGVTAALLTATLSGLLSPQISAIFAVLLMSQGSKALTLKQSLMALAALFFLGLTGLLLGNIVQDFAWESILIIGLIIFWSFRLSHIPEPIRMLFLMFSVLFPFLSLTAEPVASLVFYDTLINFAIALFMTQLAFLLFPDKAATQEAKKEETKQEIEKYDLDKVALNGLFVLLPAVLYFFLFRPNTLIITFVFIIVLGLDPLMYKSKKIWVLLLSNFMGGVAAVIGYNLLTVAPNLGFYIVVLLGAGLYFTYNTFSDKKTAAIYPMAYRTFFLVLGVISSSTEGAGDNFSSRMWGIALAILYVVLAYHFLNFINDPRRHEAKLA